VRLLLKKHIGTLEVDGRMLCLVPARQVVFDYFDMTFLPEGVTVAKVRG